VFLSRVTLIGFVSVFVCVIFYSGVIDNRMCSGNE